MRIQGLALRIQGVTSCLTSSCSAEGSTPPTAASAATSGSGSATMATAGGSVLSAGAPSPSSSSSFAGTTSARVSPAIGAHSAHPHPARRMHAIPDGAGEVAFLMGGDAGACTSSAATGSSAAAGAIGASSAAGRAERALTSSSSTGSAATSGSDSATGATAGGSVLSVICWASAGAGGSVLSRGVPVGRGAWLHCCAWFGGWG